MGNICHVQEKNSGLVIDIHQLDNLWFWLLNSKDSGVIIQEMAKLSLGEKFKENQSKSYA